MPPLAELLREERRSLGLAARTEVARLAAKREEMLALARGTKDPREPPSEPSAVEELVDRGPDHGAERTGTRLEALLVRPDVAFEVLVEEPVERRPLGVSRAVDRGRLRDDPAVGAGIREGRSTRETEGDWRDPAREETRGLEGLPEEPGLGTQAERSRAAGSGPRWPEETRAEAGRQEAYTSPGQDRSAPGSEPRGVGRIERFLALPGQEPSRRLHQEQASPSAPALRRIRVGGSSSPWTTSTARSRSPAGWRCGRSSMRPTAPRPPSRVRLRADPVTYRDWR